MHNKIQNYEFRIQNESEQEILLTFVYKAQIPIKTKKELTIHNS